MVEEPRHVLFGTRLSPPLEAVRWLFERQRLAYEERSHVPGFHAWRSRRGGVASEPPLLIAPEGAFGGLLDCLHYLEDSARPQDNPFGADDAARARAWALIETLHAQLFLPALRLYYKHMLPHPEVTLRFATEGAPGWEATLARRFYGTWAKAVRKKLAIDAHDAAQSRASVERAFAAAAAELVDGLRFIGGDAPGAVDIVFASLAAPVLLPDRDSAPSPSLADAPAPFSALVEQLRATPGGELALRIFAARPEPQRALTVPATRRSLLERIATPGIVRLAARLAARLGPRRVRFRGATLVFRWADVRDILRRDTDFQIAPVNAARIEAVSGPFILGMDRSEALFAQRRVVYSALRNVAPGPVAAVLATEPDRLLDLAARRSGKIDVVNFYARPIAARVAAALFGIAGPSEADQMRVARAVFHETFLNLGGDRAVAQVGIAAGRELLDWIETETGARHAAGDLGQDLLGRLLAKERVGEIAREQTGQILAGLLVGSIDTTATAVANIAAEMLTDKELAEAIARDASDRERLWGWCLEALRRRPHNPILLREAADGAMVGGRSVPKGERVIAVTLSAMQDGRVFDAPAVMTPTRPRDLYMHFGHGLHLCSGRDLNPIQIPALVGALARRRPTGAARVINRGPFPDTLVVELRSTP